MAANPKYGTGDTVYLRESAALGFLEGVVISGMMYRSQWMYSVQLKGSLPNAANQYGDKISMVNSAQIFFSENEFVSLCEALALAEANAQRVLDQLKAQKASLCS